MPIYAELRRNTYLDSVSLMSISTKVNQLPGVVRANLGMGTSMNKQVLGDLGMLTSELEAAGGGDLMVVFEAAEDADLEQIKADVERLLNRSDSDDAPAAEFKARTLATALAQNEDANVVVVSVNGAFAAREAETALHAGRHVMMFSDNVTIAEEKRLKQLAHDKGLLMMGPDCGTAIINGVGLCFANRVRRGRIGIVAASGTGAQEVAVRIHDFGGGVSQLIGTGGRDLSAEIGGIMMVDGIEALAADDDTDVIVVVSKPADPQVEKRVYAAAGATAKPVIVCILGSEPRQSEYPNVQQFNATKPAALAAIEASGIDTSTLNLHALNWPLIEDARKRLSPQQKYVRGLFCGGTLCDEAMFAALEKYPDVYSNIARDPQLRLGARDKSRNHTFIDLGDDEFTNGRPHPMIDPTLRNERIIAEAADPEVGVIVLDFAIGFGSHPDPVGATMPAIKEAFEIARKDGRTLLILGYVLGTDLDSPTAQSQYQQLLDAGVIDASSSTNTGLLAREFVAKEA